MIEWQRNQTRFFSIDLETADARLLARILKDRSQQLLTEGRVEIERRLIDYSSQITRYALPGAELFSEEDFAELCIHLATARRWQVAHRPKHWDQHGQVIVTLDYGDAGERAWTSREWRIAPRAPVIEQLRLSLRQLAPENCAESEPD